MITVKCIQKFRNKNNQITGYKLQDCTGAVKDVTPEQLKNAIRSNSVSVVNLKLTSDGKLIDSAKESITDDIEIVSGAEANKKLLYLESGMPLQVQLSPEIGYKQVVFVGIKDIQYRESFVFFDGSSLTGTFGLTSKFIENNRDKVKFKFNDNNPEELAMLLDMIHRRKKQ